MKKYCILIILSIVCVCCNEVNPPSVEKGFVVTEIDNHPNPRQFPTRVVIRVVSVENSGALSLTWERSEVQLGDTLFLTQKQIKEL